MPSLPPHAAPGSLPGNLLAPLAENSPPAVGNGPQSLWAQWIWNRAQIHVSTHRSVLLVHLTGDHASCSPETCPWVHPCSPCTDTYKWPCHNPVYTHGPVSTLLIPSHPCPHRRGLFPCWHAHMHTHVRPVVDILTRWCGYTPAHAGVGRLSDSCQTAALLGIGQVPAADQGELGF